MKENIPLYPDSRPYTRWWWFAAEYDNEDIKRELEWINLQGFGGVEIAFIYPVERDPGAKRFKWLGKEWQEAVCFTKQYADSLGLGCDFTFGTLWPFGGTFVSDEDRTKVFGNSDFRQPLRLSWTHPDTGNVLDHLSKDAFQRYSEIMGKALEPALEGKPSALFCDSWEVETRKIWTTGFDSIFLEKYGYDIVPYMDSIYSDRYKLQRYDYMKLVSGLVINNFYKAFTKKCHELGDYSRVQCVGSPTDLIKAYSVVDVPETEAMLYNPSFSRIVASSAALAEKPIVSCETFTCLYGWPREHMMKEKINDLKMVADACFANGVNQIIWHGKPFSFTGEDETRFYATVHVGKKASLSEHFSGFNKYMTKVSKLMRRGKTYTDIAVYLPLEDAWIAGEYPEELQLPWAWGQYELRYLKFNDELKGYHPLWINNQFLESGIVKDKKLHVGKSVFHTLYIDVDYLDIESFKTIYDIAKKGLPVILKKSPRQANYGGDREFDKILKDLLSLENVKKNMNELSTPKPLLEGAKLPDYWIRKTDEGVLVFFANPKASNLKYPLEYGFSFMKNDSIINIKINYKEHSLDHSLVFKQYQSVLLKISDAGEIITESLITINIRSEAFSQNFFNLGYCFPFW